MIIIKLLFHNITLEITDYLECLYDYSKFYATLNPFDIKNEVEQKRKIQILRQIEVIIIK